MVSSTERRHQSAVAEQFEQQGASSSVQQAADEALLEALLQEERRQLQQGGAGSRAQRVLWPRVGSESALPDDVLLGFSCEDPAFTQRAALSVPPPTQPPKPLPSPLPPQLAAPPGSAFCIGNSTPCADFAVQRVDWPHVASESARDLPHDVLLGDRTSAQRAALSAPPPTQPLAPLPTAMASPLAALPGSAPGSTSSCIAEAQGPAPPGAAGPPPGAAGPPPGAAGPPSRAAGSAVAEWAAEQGGAGEAGADWHRQQQGLTQEATLAQWKACGSTPSRAAAALPIRCSTGSLFDTPCHAASVA
ncbi:unnamed protein product [Closterium sp. NIES-64]|nr:unnamed protein product [Closterium sp. NIES-64]